MGFTISSKELRMLARLNQILSGEVTFKEIEVSGDFKEITLHGITWMKEAL